MSYDINEIVAELNEHIATAPIAVAGPGQWIDRCGWSRTGWAVCERDGSSWRCTCRPAEEFYVP